MTEDKRTPAFWRVVRYVDGERLYRSVSGDWTTHAARAWGFMLEREAAESAKFYGGKAVPAYHRVVKKPKGHGIGWAMAKYRNHNRVRRRGWAIGCVYTGQRLFCTDLLSRDWELAE